MVRHESDATLGLASHPQVAYLGPSRRTSPFCSSDRGSGQPYPASLRRSGWWRGRLMLGLSRQKDIGLIADIHLK